MWTWIIGILVLGLLSGLANKASPVLGPIVTGLLVFFGLPLLFLIYIWNR